MRRSVLLAALALLVAACATAAGGVQDATTSSSTTTSSTTTTTLATTTTAPPTTTTAPPPPPPPPTTTAPPPPPRTRAVVEQDWIPFAAAGGVTLRYPSRRVERVGFHQSNHEGAQQLEVLPGAVAPVTLDSRGRYTADRTAADVVSDPVVEVRAPVTGTVKEAGPYTLYCRYTDDYVIIEPDDHPGWEVKILHILGLHVAPGNRVVAGETVIADHPHQLPFKSDVDDYRTADPAWPHVHVEIDDPSIRNVPNPGSGC